MRTLSVLALSLLAGCQTQSSIPQTELNLFLIMADADVTVPDATLTVSSDEVTLQIEGAPAGSWTPQPRAERWEGCEGIYADVSLELWDLVGDDMTIAGQTVTAPSLSADCDSEGATIQPGSSTVQCEVLPCFEFSELGADAD